ncbi:MAG: 2-oxo-hepta-3-ene-1,7-dioic acid hydratase [Pseudomonadota bacterium]
MNPAELGAELAAAERDGCQIGILSQSYPDLDMDGAYAIQDAVVAAKEAYGARRTGWKIGLTSRAMQEALGITTPDSGVLFDDMHFESGALVPRGRFIAPRIEAEIAFVLGADITGPVDRAGVLASTAYVAPSLEILDTRILRQDPATGATRKVFDTIADNAANAGIVLGPARHDPGTFDLSRVGAALSRDGVVEETGLGAGVLGDPVLGLVWLAERLSAYGQVMRAGEVILSGSFIRPVEAPPGSRFDADFGDFGRIAVDFAA